MRPPVNTKPTQHVYVTIIHPNGQILWVDNVFPDVSRCDVIGSHVRDWGPDLERDFLHLMRTGVPFRSFILCEIPSGNVLFRISLNVAEVGEERFGVLKSVVADSRFVGLPASQLNILNRLVAGMSPAEVAEEIGVTRRTVDRSIQEIKKWTKIKTTGRLIALAGDDLRDF